MNDGHPEQVTARGGAEVIGSKDLTVIRHTAVRFVSALVLDGVLDRFDKLNGGGIQLGAGWALPVLLRLPARRRGSRPDRAVRAVNRITGRSRAHRVLREQLPGALPGPVRPNLVYCPINLVNNAIH